MNLKVKIWHEPNTACVEVTMSEGKMVTQEIGINSTFEDVELFVHVLSHEYIHATINVEVDVNTSTMFDNIDGWWNGHRITAYGD